MTTRRPLVLLPDGTLSELPSGAIVLLEEAMIGATPGGARYEMNTGEFDPPLVQLATLGPWKALLEGFRFADDSKAVVIQLGKSRGNGDPNSPDCFKPSTQGERLVQINGYGSSSHGNSHATYLLIGADYASDDGNEQAATLDLCTSNARTRGNGVKINSLSQVSLAGANMAKPIDGTDYKAILWLGPGGISAANPTFPAVPLRFTSGALVAAAVSGAVEYDGSIFHITTDDLVRRQLLTVKPLPITTVTTPISGVTISATIGQDWAQVTVTPAADVTDAGTGLTIANINFSPALAAAPAVVGSLSTKNTSADARASTWRYVAAATRIQIFLSSGRMEAGVAHTFTLIWRIP